MAATGLSTVAMGAVADRIRICCGGNVIGEGGGYGETGGSAVEGGDEDQDFGDRELSRPHG